MTALGKGTRGRLYERLAASGILRAEEGRVLGLWTEREYQDWVVETLVAALLPGMA